MEQALRRDEEPEKGYILLTLRAVPEDGQYTSYCDELEIASCGDTIEEAFEMIMDAVDGYLQELVDLGTLPDVLREQNIYVDFEPPVLRNYRMPVQFAETSQSATPTYRFHRQLIPMPA